MTQRTLSLRLVDVRGPNRAVDARDFADLVSAALACLRRLEDESGSSVVVAYRLVGLELGSAVVKIRPESKDDRDSTAREVAASFERGFRALTESKIAETSFSPRTQQSFVAIQKPLRRGSLAIELTGRERHRLDYSTVSRKSKLPKQEMKSFGSVFGQVKAINIHGDKVFHVYPASGPTRVACHFSDDMLQHVQNAIGRYVTVHGAIDYDSTETFPARVTVREIEICEEDRPKLKDLFGLVPDLTGGVESAAYIRAIRDAEE